MKTLYRRGALLGALMLATLTAACRTEPMYEVKEHPMPYTASDKLSAQDLEKAIVEAANTSNWTGFPTKPGLVRANLTVGSHKAVADVFFTSTSYSITLNSSSRFKQDDQGNIHRAYNAAVRTLEANIERSVVRAVYLAEQAEKALQEEKAKEDRSKAEAAEKAVEKGKRKK